MKSRLLSLLLAVSSAWPAEVRAQPGLTYFDCDTPVGHYSSAQLSLGPEQKSFSGVIRLVRAFRNRQWGPTVGIGLRDERNEVHVKVRGVRVSFEELRVKDDIVTAGVIFETLVSGGPIEGKKASASLAEVELGSDVPFVLTSDGEKVDYQIGNRSGSVTIALQGTLQVMLSCSTGQFKFDKLKQF